MKYLLSENEIKVFLSNCFRLRIVAVCASSTFNAFLFWYFHAIIVLSDEPESKMPL